MAELFKILPFFALMNIADCYRLLGLREGASFDEIKASYRRLARQYHPDVNPQNQQQAKDKFIQLTEAYKHLISVVPPSGASGANQSTSQPAATEAPAPAARPQAARVTPKPTVTVKRQGPTVQFNPSLSEAERQLKQSSYEQLQQFLKGQRFPRAIALVEGLAQRIPQDPEIRQWQAITYQRCGRYLISQNQLDKARIYLKKALRTDPHNRSLWSEVEQDFRRMEKIF